MHKTAAELREDAERIWHAGVAAVQPERIVPEHVHVDGQTLVIADDEIDLRRVERIAIVGAGKAAGAMAVALETVLGDALLAEKKVVGWVNVPSDCVVQTKRVHLHAARPAGVNEPRREGVLGTERILKIVSTLGSSDLCLCVFTGGGSALLPAPVEGVSLDDKIHVTLLLSAAGANIEQLNLVRRHLSLSKGGGIAAACKAGRFITLLISDVPGDRIDIIASGPTARVHPSPASALAVLEELGIVSDASISGIVDYLRNSERKVWESLVGSATVGPWTTARHVVMANNAMAVDAAGVEAERLGYSHAMISAKEPEGAAEEVGRHLAQIAVRMRGEQGPDCLITGGEPTVTLVDPSVRGRGGRNQQLALAALAALGDAEDLVILSGGTDGEDGPTDAAGAIVSEEVVRAARELSLDAQDYLARNDAYEFFRQAGGLFVTGPTHTNVCDLRVVVASQRQSHHH